MNNKKSALIKLIIMIGIEAFIVILMVWFFDPFYQYHAPLGSLQAVLSDRDNQMVGSIRNFDYDSALVGSSVVENCNSDYINEQFNTSTLKIIKASGSTADLMYYVEMAQEKQELEYIFWNLDLSALSSELSPTLNGNDVPRYLHTKTVMDDIPYLFNKEVLLERIPYMLACAVKEKYIGGQAYNWAEGKIFGAEAMMKFYTKSKTMNEVVQNSDFDRGIIEQNVQMLVNQVQAHPDTQYYFFFPPYSMCWWDSAYLNGMLEQHFFTFEYTMQELLALQNVNLYFFQDNSDIICNLDNYMDMIHYSPQINQYMLESICIGNHQITEENREQILWDMRGLVEQIVTEEIYKYYEQ